MSDMTPGERFADGQQMDEMRTGRHLWTTLGYRRISWEPGQSEVAWNATEDYCFPTAERPVVQGGLVTALLDAAMGGATWMVLDRDQAFLTADLRVEFLRSSHPGGVHGRWWGGGRSPWVFLRRTGVPDGDRGRPAADRFTQVVLP